MIRLNAHKNKVDWCFDLLIRFNSKHDIPLKLFRSSRYDKWSMELLIKRPRTAFPQQRGNRVRFLEKITYIPL